MSNKGMTNKPCPGCGYQPSPYAWSKRVMMWRNKGELCETCKELLEEARQRRKELARKPEGYVFTPLGHSMHCNPGYYEARCDDKVRDEMMSVIYGLIRSLSDVVTTVNPYSPKEEISESIFHCRPERVYETVAVKMREDHYQLLRRLDAVVRQLMRSCYAYGKEYGQSLLRQLADGELSVEDLNDKLGRS